MELFKEWNQGPGEKMETTMDSYTQSSTVLIPVAINLGSSALYLGYS
jgi:hypothetical protein